MSPGQLEQLAREAGLCITQAGMVIDAEYGGAHIRKLSRFAALIRAAALEEAARACAQARTDAKQSAPPEHVDGIRMACVICEGAIIMLWEGATGREWSRPEQEGGEKP